MNLVTLEPIWRPDHQQRAFRMLLDAMSYPGRVFDLHELLGDSRAELAVLACLVDDVVAYSDPDARLNARERGMLNAHCIAPELADYVLHDASCPPAIGYTPRLGDLYRPDSAATLILSGAEVGAGPLTLLLEGPGIERQAELPLAGFHTDWFSARADWVSNFPQGVDIFLCDRTRISALPRTCEVVIG
jgi:alpha-D-ribose 1-methylphosphonate 5-triphosphate synthase subunit PhnH